MTSSSGGLNGLPDPEHAPSAPATAADAAVDTADAQHLHAVGDAVPVTDAPTSLTTATTTTTTTTSTATTTTPTFTVPATAPEASPSIPQKAPSPGPVPPPSTPPANHASVAIGQNPNRFTASDTDRSQHPDVDAAPKDSLDSDHLMLDAPLNAVPSISEAEAAQIAVTPIHNSLVSVDPFAPSTPYTPVQMSNINQQAYMIMALASMSNRPSAMSPPPTVTPSQVTLPNPIEESFGLAASESMYPAPENKELESFARIEFADSVFQMTTYSVIIGRDQRALKQARVNDRREDEYRSQVEENARRGLPPPSPIALNRTKFSKSYVSEEGGMLGPESEDEEDGRPAKRRKTSTAGSSKDEINEAQENMITNRQYVSHTPGAAAVDLASLRPNPWHVAFLGIHSPGPDIAAKTKAISRNHMKIEYNQKENVFEAVPIHRNGFFCEDVHYKDGRVVLRCGDRLQVKDVDFTFVINGVERGCTGGEDEHEQKKKQPLKKRHAHGVHDTSDELSEPPSSPEAPDFGEDEEGEDAEADAEAEAPEPMDIEAEEEEEEEELEAEEPTPGAAPTEANDPMLDPTQLIPQIPKKRGPGRPPKNGIMSKREQRLLKKQQQEMAKKSLPQAPPVEPPVKRKVGRPRKHPLPDNEGDRPEKRKYKPRKPKGEDGAEGSDAERRAKEKKEKRTRPKSPPLDLKLEDYTPEQLQKPNKNYGVLIDEALTAAGSTGLTLKQIYKRICENYPWFYFHTETKGWESSVRHNLIGNAAFRKDEALGVWYRVNGVELDAGKKRKAPTPDRGLTAQAYGAYSYPYGQPQQMAPGAPAYPQGQVPQGYQAPGYNPQQPQAARPMQPYDTSMSPPGQPAQVVASQPPAPAQLPAGYGPPPAPARPPLGGPQPGTYSSPYASRPPPPTNPPIKGEDGHVPAAPVAPAAAVPPAQPAPVMVPGINPQVSGTPPAPANPAMASQPSAAGPPVPGPPPAAPVPLRPVVDPRLLQAVVNLKNGLIMNLKKARNPVAENIVMSALNRCIGLKKEPTENDKMEAICMKGIRQVIDGAYKTKSPTPGGSASAESTPSVLEAKVLASLNGFKDISIRTLGPKVGDAKAEALTLSAIDRVLGFADASIVPAPAEGESSGNFEGVEKHLMASVRQLLVGMKQKVRELPS